MGVSGLSMNMEQFKHNLSSPEVHSSIPSAKNSLVAVTRHLILDFFMWNHDANNDIPMETHASTVSRLPEAYFNISVHLNHLYSQLVHMALDVKGS